MFAYGFLSGFTGVSLGLFFRNKIKFSFPEKKNGTSNWLKVLQFVSGTDLMSMISEFLKDASVCLWH